MKPVRVEFIAHDGRRTSLSDHVSALSLDLNPEGPRPVSRVLVDPSGPFGRDVVRDFPLPVRDFLRNAARMAQAHGYDLVLEKQAPKAPKWKRGDVVVLKFAGNPTPYTYVHDGRRFPGITVPRTDAAMTEAWERGEATLLVRDGANYEDVPLADRPRRQEALQAEVRRTVARHTWREW